MLFVLAIAFRSKIKVSTLKLWSQNVLMNTSVFEALHLILMMLKDYLTQI